MEHENESIEEEAFRLFYLQAPWRLSRMQEAPITFAKAALRGTIPRDQVPRLLRWWFERNGLLRDDGDAPTGYRSAPTIVDGPLPDARPWYRRLLERRPPA